jgi:hypothetical protein
MMGGQKQNGVTLSYSNEATMKPFLLKDLQHGTQRGRHGPLKGSHMDQAQAECFTYIFQPMQ